MTWGLNESRDNLPSYEGENILCHEDRGQGNDSILTFKSLFRPPLLSCDRARRFNHPRSLAKSNLSRFSTSDIHGPEDAGKPESKPSSQAAL